MEARGNLQRSASFVLNAKNYTRFPIVGSKGELFGEIPSASAFCSETLSLAGKRTSRKGMISLFFVSSGHRHATL
jgi:hypothetical protein